MEKTSAEDTSADKAEDADAADTADSDTDEAAEENKEETGDEDIIDEEKEADEEMAEAPAVSYPSITFDDSITVSAGSLSTDTESKTGDSGLAAETEITVHVEADEDTFPEGTTMRLAAVTDDQMDAVTEAVEGAMAEAADAQGTSSRTQGFHAVDISFLNADGIEIEPLKPIKVSMTSEAIKRAVEDSSTAPVVVHVDETVDVSKSAATVDNNHTVIGETVEGNTEVVADTLTFEAGSFSVYAIVYTVDFHWNVDGKGYEYSIQGGSAITLSELLPLVNIVKDDPETGIDEVKSFLEDVEKVQFSAPELVWVEKVEEDTTIGDIEDLHKFVVQYSDDITDEQREEYRDKTVSAGDWALISVQPFDSEEVLSVTMKNGERFIVRVTDAQEITNSESSEIDVNKSYLICYETGEGNAKKYYLLKNDGSVDVCTKNGGTYYINGVRQSSSITSISDLFESLNSTYFWSFHYIFTEKDVASTLNNNYYLIRPIDLRSKTLTLNNAGESIVQPGNNNTAVIPVNDDNGSFAGFIFQGYHNVGTEDEPRFIHLGFDGSAFTGMDGDSSIFHVYEMDTLPSYDYSVSTHKLYGYDYSQGPRGSVSVQGILADTVTETNPNDDNDTTVYSFDVYNCTSTAEKKNGAVITADCVRKTSTVSGADRRDNKWLFDHWELNGVELPESVYSVVEKDYKNRPLKVQINTDSLDIPFNGSNLVAFFRQNPDYKVPDSEKQPTSFEDMTEWFNRLTDPDREIPFDGSATDKTAEVYDYENRIYRVDIKTKADYETFSGDIDIGFSLDVSNSMKFPASLKYATYGGNTLDEFSIYSLNDNTSSLDTNRRFNNPYYIIADKNQTSTVLKLYYEPNNFRVYNDNQWKNYNSGWYVQDAAFEEHAFSGTNPRFNRIGKTKFKPSWTSESYYWLNSGDSSSTTYPIYDHGDENSYDRFHYLKECFTGASGDLETIMETLRIAGDESPDVFMAYNTFCKTKKSTSTGTMNASDLKPGETNAFFEAEETTVEFKNDADGGTRPDLAFADALKWNWRSPNKYLILITDGAPQGGDNTSYDGTTTGSNNSDRVDWADAAAADLKKGKDGVVGFNTATGDNDDIKIISIGLGMKEVEEGRKLLYRIADIDPKSGDRMFYLVDDAADLRNVLRQIIRTLMEEASVNTDITDTVGEAFYLVDKNTGLPLSKGDMLDINGNITTDPDEAAGIVQEDGRTVKWIDQSVDGSNGWHGTIYVKAKEDLIGGNAVKTNEEARIEADSYTVSGITYDFVENQYDHRLKLTIPFEESPPP